VVSRKAKLRIEAPVNGGRNYNGPKVDLAAALEKLGYMLESLSILSYEGRLMLVNPTSIRVICG